MTEPGHKPRANRWLFAGQCALGIGLILWLVATGRFDIGVFLRFWSQDSLLALSAIVVLQAAALTIHLGKWRLLVPAAGLDVDMRTVLTTGAKGSFLNLFVPASMGPEGVRFMHAYQHHRQQLDSAAASLMVDRLLSVCGLLLVGLGFGALQLISQGHQVWYSLVVINGGLLLCLVAALVLSTGIIRLPGQSLLERVAMIRRITAAFARFSTQPRAMLAGVLCAVGQHLLIGISWVIGIGMFGDTAPSAGVVSISAAVTLAMGLPITPMGLGVTDGMSEGLFMTLGVSSGAELLMFMRLVSMLLFALCGLAFLLPGRAANGARQTSSSGH